MPVALAAQACIALSASGVMATCRGTPPIAQWNNLKGRDVSTDISTERCHTFDALSALIREPWNDAIEGRAALTTVAEDDPTQLEIDNEDDIDTVAQNDPTQLTSDIEGDIDSNFVGGLPMPAYAVDTSNRFGAFGVDEASGAVPNPCESPHESDVLSPVAELVVSEAINPKTRQRPNRDQGVPSPMSRRTSPRDRAGFQASAHQLALPTPVAEGPAVPADASAAKVPAARKKKKSRTSGRAAPEVPSGPPPSCSSDQPTPNTAADQHTEIEAPAAGAQNVPGHKPLVGEKAEALALLTVRLNQQVVKSHLRMAGARQMILATPVDPGKAGCADMLEINLGTVVHCEATDSSGWGFGSVVAPARLAGQRGCFQCEGMRPILVELRTAAQGVADSLECSPGSWTQVGQLHPPTTQGRLRQKAMLNKLRATRLAFEKR